MSETATSIAATKPEHHRFHLLDALRGIAAVIVMMLHAPPQYSAPFLFQNSFLAVDFFFCLSGFVIAFSYEDRLKTSMSLVSFTIARAIRLYPLAILGTLLGAAFMLAGFSNHGRLLTTSGITSYLALSLLMIPSNRYDVLFPLNPVMWTLFFELLANILYATMIRAHIAKSSVLLILALCSLAYLIATCKKSGTFDFGYAAQQFFVGLSRIGLSFIAGVLTFRAYRFAGKQSIHGTKALIGASVIVSSFCLILCDAISITKLPFVQLGIASIVFPGIVYAGAHCAIALTSLCSFLGTISYPLYALHDVLLEPMFSTRFLQFANHHSGSAPAWMLAAATTLIAISWLSAKYWDAPIRSALTVRFNTSITNKMVFES